MNTEILAAKIAFGDIEMHDYSDWAENLLIQGVESKNIIILASFGLDKNIDKYEIEIYFKKCVTELKIIFPDHISALKTYAKLRCLEILKVNSSLKTEVDKLSGLARLTEHEEPLFRIWDEFSEDIWFAENQDYQPIWNSGLTKENQVQYIKEFAKQFLQLLELQLPINFWQLSYCESCKHLGGSIIKSEKKRMPVIKFPTEQTVNYAACENCLAPYPLTMTDFMGRKAYIENL